MIVIIEVFASDDSDREITLTCKVNGPCKCSGYPMEAEIQDACWSQGGAGLDHAEFDKLVPDTWEEFAIQRSNEW